MARTVIYGTHTMTIEDDSQTLEAIKASMAEVFGELANAQVRQEGDKIYFEVKAGTKGMARTVIYGTHTMTIEDDSQTLEAIKASMAEVFGELANAQVRQEGDKIYFEVKAGTKGMARTVIYGTHTMTIEDDSQTLEAIKASMAEVFGELANAQVRQEGDKIYFEVKAGTKGARTVVYGTHTMTIEDDSQTLDAIKASMAEVFGELANAQVRQEGDKIYFEVKAGTKGARTVIYGTHTMTIEDDSQSLEAIKASMAEVFGELANAQVRQEGDKIYFEVKAGTKGIGQFDGNGKFVITIFVL